MLGKAEDAARIFSRRLAGSQSSADLRRLTIVSAQGTAKRIQQPLRRRLNHFRSKIGKPDTGSVIGNFSSDSVHKIRASFKPRAQCQFKDCVETVILSPKAKNLVLVSGR
jgi:hypothetical protein